MKSCISLCVVGLGSVLAFPAVGLAEGASTYQNVLGFSYGQYSDSDDTSEITMIQFDAVHYLQPVNVANHPLAEAAFLERAASIGFLFNQVSFGENGYSSDQTTYVAKINYASATNPLTFSAEYMGTNISSNDFYGDLSGNQFLVKLGSYVSTSGRIQALFLREEFESETGTTTGIDAKLVKELGNSTSFGIEGAIYGGKSDSDFGSIKSNGYTLGVDYYASRMTSLGFIRYWETYKDKDGSFDRWTHQIHIKHFLSSTTFIAFEYVNSDTTDPFIPATNGFNVKFSLHV